LCLKASGKISASDQEGDECNAETSGEAVRLRVAIWLPLNSMEKAIFWNKKVPLQKKRNSRMLQSQFYFLKLWEV